MVPVNFKQIADGMTTECNRFLKIAKFLYFFKALYKPIDYRACIYNQKTRTQYIKEP